MFTMNTRPYIQLEFLKWWSYKNDSFALFKLPEHIWNLIENELWHIKFYMNTVISNWHIWSINHSKMKILSLFLFDTRLLLSKYPKLFTTLLLRRNRELWKTCFSAAQNGENEFQLKHKRQVRYWRYLSVRSSSMKNYACH